jgi:hypothetical protein
MRGSWLASSMVDHEVTKQHEEHGNSGVKMFFVGRRVFVMKQVFR